MWVGQLRQERLELFFVRGGHLNADQDAAVVGALITIMEQADSNLDSWCSKSALMRPGARETQNDRATHCGLVRNARRPYDANAF